MLRIYDAGFRFKKEESIQLRDHFIIDINSKNAKNPDAQIPFIALKSIFLRPNIDEGSKQNHIF